MPQTRLHKHISDILKSQENFSYTAPEIKKNISNYGVLVGGKLIKNQLEWVYPEQTFEFTNWPTRERGDTSKIKIVYEDDDCLVINKPFGLVVEPGAGHRFDNLTQWLFDNYTGQDFRKRYQNQVFEFLNTTIEGEETKQGTKKAVYSAVQPKEQMVFKNGRMRYKNTQQDDEEYEYSRSETIETNDKAKTFGNENKFSLPASGLAHRIDKDTQGLLIIAKSIEAFKFLQDQFRAREVTKKYLAVVEGQFEKTIEIHNWQSRDKANPIRQKFFWTQSEAVSFDPMARNAHSILQPILYCADKNQSLIQIQIKTGRMHQIRLQCENLGFPLVGDKVYYRKLTFDQTTFSSNPDNKEFYSLNQKVKEVSSEEFETEKTRIFGQSNYCLLSNELEIILPSQKLSKFVLFEVL